VPSPHGDRSSLSILVVCRNYERYVGTCLRSVFGADQDVQLVFLDNGSKDGSVAAAREVLRDAPPHVSWKVVAQESELPLCRALNLAVAECTGEFLKPISADDWLGPNFFTTFRELVTSSDMSVGVWLAGSVIVDETDKAVRQTFSPVPFGSPNDGKPVWFDERAVIEPRYAPPHSMPSFFFRRKVLDDVGGFDERFRFEDKPFLFNVLKQGWRIAVYPFNNTYYRVHSQNISAKPLWLAEARVPILLDQTLRARWRNKPFALVRLLRNVRVVAINRWRNRAAA